MQPAFERASVSITGKSEAPQAANSGSLCEISIPAYLYPMQAPDATPEACGPDALKASSKLVRRKRAGKFIGRRRASKLLRDVQRLARWRCANGVVIEGRDKHQFAWAMAKLLVGMLPTYEERVRLTRLHNDDPGHGLDFITLSRAMKDAGLEPFSEAETMTLIHDVQSWHDKHPNCPFSGTAIGKALHLTALERREVKCWNVLAIDESKQQRDEWRKEQNRIATRMRMRAKRESQHRKRLSEVERRRAFCEAHNITERTVRRWLKQSDPRVRNLFDSDIDLNTCQTESGHSANA